MFTTVMKCEYKTEKNVDSPVAGVANNKIKWQEMTAV